MVAFVITNSFADISDLTPQKWMKQAALLVNKKDEFKDFLEYTLSAARAGDTNAQLAMGTFYRYLRCLS